MTFEIAVVFGLIILAVFLFAMESVPFDLAALVIMSSLMLSGILTVEEGFSGFANPATITIAAMFTISEGVRRTGALRVISRYFTKLGKMRFPVAMVIIMGIIAMISAFINNTAAVVIFIPVLMATASKMNISPSKILLPLSFASMFGGVCTLLGTSTNILVSSIAQKNGLEPFSMFEFAPLGIILMAAGFIYLFIVGIKIVPPRRKLEDLTKNFRMNEYLADVQINGNFQYIGKPLSEVEQFWRMNIDVIRVYREDSEIPDYRVTPLQENDVLRIRGNAKEIDKLIRSRPGLDVKPAKDWGDVDLTRGHYALVEAVIAPDSDYDSRTVESIDFFENYGAVVLGIYKQGKPERENLDQIRLRGGDSLLLTLGKDRVPNLRNDKNFVIVSDIVLEHFNRKKIPYALTILGGVVLTAALNIAPIVLSAATGVILMIFTGCLKTRDIYRSINWKVIFLLAGVIPLGIAMQKTGAAQILSNFIVDSVGHLGPRAVLSGYFLMTMLLTAMISNQATAAILASIAIETAGVLGVHPKPFLMAITFAASLSFITPWSHQANTLVYGPGQFKFTDFTKVGIPLNLILWVLATIFIPVFWNF